MSGPKDLAIKLFGKTIPLSDKSSNAVVAATKSGIFTTCNDDYINNDKRFDQNHGHGEEMEDEKDIENDTGDRKEDRIRSKQGDSAPPVASEEFTNPEATNGASDQGNGLSVDKENAALETCKIDKDRSETSNPEEKTTKKSNKVLPCPRCKSMDTKFCYYNNYNVSQPRHFCKNCQRYWTAGGTMRNVPVGAGRRKSKNSSSHCRHVVSSEPLRSGPNDETMCNPTQNRFHKPEELNIHVSYGGGEKGMVCLNGSSVPTLNNEISKVGSHDQTMPSCRSFPPQVPCFPRFFLWNSARWSSPVPPPTLCPPMPFYPTASYWGCSMPATWNVPWLPQPCSDTQTVQSSGSNSPSLGKHSRDENMEKLSNTGGDEPVKETDRERCVWIPKTMRINDPDAASRRSLRVTSGSKNDDERLFNGFNSKGDERNRVLKISPILQANPAALSRSMNFHESS